MHDKTVRAADLQDEAPRDFNQEYAPDPRASQRVAAQRRARQDDEDAPRAATRRPIPPALVAAIGILAIAGVVVLAFWQYSVSRPMAVEQRMVATEPARMFQTSYQASPAPRTATEVPPPPTFTPPPVATPVVAPQTGQGLTLNTDDWTPEATPTPPPAEPTATVVVWPTSAPVQASDFEKPDIKDRCKFIGCLGQQAVDLSRAQACGALYWQYGDADPETIPEPDLSAVRACVWEGLYK